MSQLIYARVRENPKYQSLVKQRGRLAAILSAIVLVSYYEGFKGRVATYIERIQFRREPPWTRSARTARVSI